MCQGLCKAHYVYYCPIYSLHLCEMGAVISPTVQVRILRPKEMKPLGKGPKAGDWQWQKSNSGLSDSRFSLLLFIYKS